VSELPPAQFDYVPFDGIGAITQSMPTAPSVPLIDGDIDLIDINGDGLPDILDTRVALSQPHAYFLNLGPDATGAPAWGPRTFMQTIIPKFLSTDDTQLVDIDGDGKTDMLDMFGQQSRYLRINPQTLTWESAGFNMFRSKQPNLTNSWR
jgi:hypothetical protein